jgi:tetratricopeptide (TPR) repeat protein
MKHVIISFCLFPVIIAIVVSLPVNAAEKPVQNSRADDTQANVVAEIQGIRGKIAFEDNDPARRVISVYITGYQATDTVLERLQMLTQLQNLGVTNCSVTDVGLKHISGLTNLRTLDLWNTKITDAGLEPIAGLPKLRALNLMLTKVTDAGLKHIEGLTALEDLNISNTGITDAGLQHLRGLTRLRSLNLLNTKVGDAGLEHLQGLSELKTLRLDGTHVTAAGLRRIETLTTLKELSLPGALPAKSVKSLRKAMPKTYITHIPEGIESPDSAETARVEAAAQRKESLVRLAAEALEDASADNVKHALAAVDAIASQSEIDVSNGFAAAEVAFLLGSPAKAVEIMERVVRDCPNEKLPGMEERVEVIGTFYLGTYARYAGDPSRARAAYKRLIAMAKEDQDSDGVAAFAQRAQCVLYLAEIEANFSQDFRKAIDLLEQIDRLPLPRLAERENVMVQSGQFRNWACYEAALLQTKLRKQSSKPRHPPVDPELGGQGSSLYLLAAGLGDTADISTSLGTAHRKAQELLWERPAQLAIRANISRIDWGFAHLSLGWLAENRGRWGEAKQHYRELSESDNYLAPLGREALAPVEKAERHHCPALSGLLLDAKGDKPIQGAAIAGIYGLCNSTVGGAVEAWTDSGETKTDSKGRFFLPEVATHFADRPRICIFAPGYESVDLRPDRQAYSRMGVKRIPIGKDIFREESRPIMSVATKNGKSVYEFRLSRLDTDAERRDDMNFHFADVSISLIPKLNDERRKYGYGVSEWRAAAVNGLVVDATDGKPIKYAVVAGIYGFHRIISGVDPQGWIDGGETITLSDGKFQLGKMSFFALPFCQLDERPRICIFAPGYESVDLRGNCDQLYSRVAEKVSAPGADAHRAKRRPILSINARDGTRVYEFRLSPLATDEARKDDLRNAFSNVPARRCPQLFEAIHREREKYGLSEWHGLKE